MKIVFVNIVKKYYQQDKADGDMKKNVTKIAMLIMACYLNILKT
jgi:hypothetical protein